MMTSIEVRNLFDYSPESGELRWRQITGNRVHIGDLVGSSQGHYRQVSIRGKRYYIHRLIWLYVYGREPIGLIDHINKDGFDNRIANLREATNQQNQANRAKFKNCVSGFKGVTRRRDDKAWCAMTRIGGKSRHLGSFPSKEDAHAAYLDAARTLFGEFASG